MATEKKVTVYVSRPFTLKRAGHEPVAFKQGGNTVDKELAEHPYVKAHMVDPEAVQVSGKELDAANARIAELEKMVADKGGKALADARARVAELEKVNNEGAALVASLNKQIDEQKATIDALVAAASEQPKA